LLDVFAHREDFEGHKRFRQRLPENG
jgi:hypothetical protein